MSVSLKFAVASALVFTINTHAIAAEQYKGVSTNPELKYTKDGIAVCDGSGGGPHTQGKMPISFANQFWSRLSCSEWKGAYQLLDNAPKASVDRGIPNILEQSKTKWTQCYLDSFPYNWDERFFRAEKDIFSDTMKVSHGFFRMDATKFAEVQRAIVFACDKKLGFNYN